VLKPFGVHREPEHVETLGAVAALEGDDEPARVRRFAGRLGLRFQIAIADEMLLDLYGPIRVIPTTFFIDRRGDIVRRVTGSVDGETLDDFARELLAP